MKQKLSKWLFSAFLSLISISIKGQIDQQAVQMMDALHSQDSISAVKIVLLVNSVNYCDLNNTSLLMLAAKNGYFKVCEILIEKGAKLDLQDKYGVTALIYATSFNHADIVRLLVNKGADKDLKSNGNRTALMIASQANNSNIICILNTNADNVSENQKTTTIQNKEPAPDSIDLNFANSEYNQIHYKKEKPNIFKDNPGLGIVEIVSSSICVGFTTAALVYHGKYEDAKDMETQNEYGSKETFCTNAAYLFGTILIITGIIDAIIPPNTSEYIQRRDRENLMLHSKNRKLILDKVFVNSNSTSVELGMRIRF